MLYSYFSIKRQFASQLEVQYHLNKYWYSLSRKLNYSHDSVVSLNTTKGYYFKTYNHFIKFFSSEIINKDLVYNSNTYTIKELNSYQVLEFPFQKRVYDTFIFFIIFLLTHNYLSFKNDFTLKYSFVIKPDNFNVLFFLNRFYFPTYNY